MRVLIADDHPLLREGLRTLLNDKPDIEVIGEAGDGLEALELVSELQPDVVLMDISMPNCSGIEATRQLNLDHPNVHVVILTVHEDESLLHEALQAGASGYALKRTMESELTNAIRMVARGDIYVHPAMSRALLDNVEKSPEDKQDSIEILTPREIEVLRLLANGFTTRIIAQMLTISVRTVQSHIAKLRDKLGLHSRTGLVNFASEHGLRTSGGTKASESFPSNEVDVSGNRIGLADFARKTPMSPQPIIPEDDFALFLNGLIHQLSNTIVPARQFIKLAKRRGNPQEYLEKVDLYLDQAIALLQRLRIPSVPWQLEPTDLFNVFRSVQEQTVIPDNIQLEINISEEANVVDTNSEGLTAVLVNLVLNAIQAMEQGGKLDITCRSSDSQYIEVRVTDTGNGISPENQTKLFESFFTTKGKDGGQGLGLWLSKQFIQRLGGSIELEKSAIGEGTTFLIKLPKVGETSILEQE